MRPRPQGISTCCILLFSLFLESADAKAGTPLVERLGLAPDSKALIVTADDVGMNLTTNVVSFQLLKQGAVTGMLAMPACPWFPMVSRFAAEHPRVAVGVHIALTSEWPRYRWGPLLGASAVPSLVDSRGYLQPTRQSAVESVTPEDAEKEGRAQIQHALANGIDVVAIDNHMGILLTSEPLARVLAKLADEFDVPTRLVYESFRQGADGFESPVEMGTFGVEHADERGVVHPDRLYLGWPPTPEKTEDFWTARIRSLEPGYVSELYVHAGAPTDEMRATTPRAWRTRTADSEFFESDRFRDLIRNEDIVLISYRELRDLQRGVEVVIPKRFGWDDSGSQVGSGADGPRGGSSRSCEPDVTEGLESIGSAISGHGSGC